MTRAGTVGTHLPPLIELGWSKGGWQPLVDLWRERELLYFLVWKDIKVKYKQTSLGIAWAILQPLFGMVLFTLLFGRVARFPSDGLPYPIFFYSALLTWTYFSTALLLASNSVVANTSLVTKIYFPRILLPAAAVTSSLLDFAIASVILLVLLAAYGIPFSPRLTLLPLLLIPLLVFTLGLGQLLAALNVNYRDVRHALPFLVQVWLFASPVVYPLSMVPDEYRWLPALNPIAGIIETSRAVIAGHPLPLQTLAVSCAMAAVTFVLGLRYFQHTERRFADVI